MTTASRPRIRSRSVPACPQCGGPGTPLYRGLRDRFAPGPEEWGVSRCADAACSLLWLDPMPLEEDIGHAYHEDYYTHQGEGPALTWYRRGFRWLKQGYLASRYGYGASATPLRQRILGQAVWFLPLRRADVDANVMHLRFRPDGRLLEVGCGSGEVLEILRDAGWEAEGVDFDPAAVATARRRGLTVHLGGLDRLGLPAGRFDAIVLRHMIEHVHDPGGLLRECRRLLRSDGVLAVLTPNADGLGHRIFRSDAFYVDPPRHLHVFNPRNLRRMVEGAGFAVQRLETHSRRARDIWIHSRAIRRTGRANPRERPSLRARMGGLLFEAFERALLVARPESGDEVFLQGGGSAHRGADAGPRGAR